MRPFFNSRQRAHLGLRETIYKTTIERLQKPQRTTSLGFQLELHRPSTIATTYYPIWTRFTRSHRTSTEFPWLNLFATLLEKGFRTPSLNVYQPTTYHLIRTRFTWSSLNIYQISLGRLIHTIVESLQTPKTDCPIRKPRTRLTGWLIKHLQHLPWHRYPMNIAASKKMEFWKLWGLAMQGLYP